MTYRDAYLSLTRNLLLQHPAETAMADALRAAEVDGVPCWHADTHRIRDLFNALRCKAQEPVSFAADTPWRPQGTNRLGCLVVSEFNRLAEQDGAKRADWNGRTAPAVWLQALYQVLVDESLAADEAEAEANRLAEQRAGMGCLAEWGE